ncbi:MAG: hypothetical protein HRU70_03750 [Phycisphaeraceae bacterium]|nr:MAG: hypothetical protein HRU70_03750 [Phycisphaeraceae bacterium]
MSPGPDQQPASATCVVLCPAGIEPGAELLAALTRPDLDLVHCRHELIALAEVCRRGRRGRNGLILLLVHPTRQPSAAELVRTVERYAPRTVVWMFDDGASPRLRAVQPADVEGWVIAAEGSGRPGLALGVPTGPTPPVGVERAKARLDDRICEVVTKPAAGGILGTTRDAEDGQSGDIGQVLTSEELSMLLADGEEPKHNEG